MMPFIYPSQLPRTCPILIITNQTYVQDDETEDGDDDNNNYLPVTTNFSSQIQSIPMEITPTLVNNDQTSPLSNDQGIFRLRMHVDGFQAEDLNLTIRHGRLIIRGRHLVRDVQHSTQVVSTISRSTNEIDDGEPDFILKEFKRTFHLPANADIRKARALYYPQQQILLIEVPFQNLTISSSSRSNIVSRIRPLDVFLLIVTILFMDRALRVTFRQFLLYDPSLSNISINLNERERED